jgi:hypothetical protein
MFTSRVGRHPPAAAAGAWPAAAQVKEYRAVVPADAQTDTGMFDVHRVGDRLLFEIPDALLGRDMLIMSRYARTQDGLADGGADMAPNIVVRWERRDDRIVLRGVSHRTGADAGTPLALAVENSNFAPVLQALPIAARGDGTSVVDVTDMYMADTPAFSLPRSGGRSWRPELRPRAQLARMVAQLPDQRRSTGGADVRGRPAAVEPARRLAQLRGEPLDDPAAGRADDAALLRRARRLHLQPADRLLERPTRASGRSA